MSGSGPLRHAGGQPRVTIASTVDELAAAMAIRHQIFVQEQGIPAELDEDGLDDGAIHALAWIDGDVVGVGRLVVSTPDTGVLARIAVLPKFRGRQIAGQIITVLEQQAASRSLRRLQLCPHEYLEDFYLRLGYHRVDGCHRAGPYDLITMEKSLAA